MEKYDVFISYRRDGGILAAKNIQEHLKERGYRVFFDLDSLRAGVFSDRLLEVIDNSKDFIIILSPNALDRCKNDGDWVRRELAHALEKKKNVIPVMLNGFAFPEELPEDIDAIRWQNGMSPSMELWDASMVKLTSFMQAKPVKRIQKQAAIIGTVAVLAVICGVLFLRTNVKQEPSLPLAQTAAVQTQTAQTEQSVQTELVTEPAAETTVQTEPAPVEPARPIHKMRSAVPNYGNSSELTYFWGQTKHRRASIMTITFLDSLEKAPEDSWDMSEAEDGGVLAWVEGVNLFVASDGVTALNENSSFLFAEFKNVRSIDFGSCVDTSQVRSFVSAFLRCENLLTLDIGSWDVSNVTEMSSMFGECHFLRALDLSRWNMTNVTSISGMFQDCTQAGIDVSNWDTSHVEEMSNVFAGCERIEYLDIADWDTSNVKYMNWMFRGCKNLREVEAENWDVSNVRVMDCMFYDCAKLRELDLSKWDISNVSEMKQMFYGCSGMLRIDLSSWENLRLGAAYGGMFGGCGKQMELICNNEQIQQEFRGR